MDLPLSDSDRVQPSPAGDPGARIVTDVSRVEWEVYDESQWDFRLALDWDALPQTENPGLIFSSKIDRRRVWPAPPNWRTMSDKELLNLCANATSMF